MPFNYGGDTGLYVCGGWGLMRIAFGGCRGCDCNLPRHVYSREGQRGDLGYHVWHRLVFVCVWCLLVGNVPMVESLGSCRDGAGSIPVACMAPPLKRKTRRSSCYERLTEAVAERTAAGGGGEVFALRRGGGDRTSPKRSKKLSRRTYQWPAVGAVVNVDDRRVQTSDAGVPAYGVNDWTNPSLLCSLACWAAKGPCAV